MKAIKKNKWYCIYASILSVVLGILGLHSCADIPLAYGSPYADFLYTGTVTDEDDKPLEGENIVIKSLVNGVVLDIKDTIKTNVYGAYSLTTNSDAFPEKVRIVAIDKDDPEIKDSVEVEPKKISEGQSTWHGGTYLIKGDIKLKKKK